MILNRLLVSVTHVWEPYLPSTQSGSKVEDPHQQTIQSRNNDLNYLTVGGAGINSKHCSLFPEKPSNWFLIGPSPIMILIREYRINTKNGLPKARCPFYRRKGADHYLFFIFVHLRKFFQNIRHNICEMKLFLKVLRRNKGVWTLAPIWLTQFEMHFFLNLALVCFCLDCFLFFCGKHICSF